MSEFLANSGIIREPVAFEPGYWAGAPGAFYEASEKAWYLTYRIRRPRGIQPDRGGEARIARSTDLAKWDDVWSVTKDQFNSASIERCALRKDAAGRWHYFVSYVDPEDGRWCISRVTAGGIEKLDARQGVPVFKARRLGLEGIKDPWIHERDGSFTMLVSVAVPTTRTSEQSHATLDIFNTGECVSATGIAISTDLLNWDWKGVVFAPESTGWDRYCRRINSFFVAGPGEAGSRLVGFYDGSASHEENYEEKTGVASSTVDGQSWHSMTRDKPLLTSPHRSGSLRYIDAQPCDRGLLLFYEFARPDGAHDLRLATSNASEFRLL
jgi:hypothetical protein